VPADFGSHPSTDMDSGFLLTSCFADYPIRANVGPSLPLAHLHHLQMLGQDGIQCTRYFCVEPCGFLLLYSLPELKHSCFQISDVIFYPSKISPMKFSGRHRTPKSTANIFWVPCREMGWKQHQIKPSLILVFLEGKGFSLSFNTAASF
jgi:hypothetical protein